MSDAPKKIWLTTTASGKVDDFTQWTDQWIEGTTEYIRADLAKRDAALLGKLAAAMLAYVQSVVTYEETPTDRGGTYGPKGTAKTLMLTRFALMRAAIIEYDWMDTTNADSL